MPKILIACPVYKDKAYPIERWAKSVSQMEGKFDVLVVDNSDDPSFQQYLKSTYPNWKVEHIDLETKEAEERVGIANEYIRKYVLSCGYDYWFAWDCDIILPPTALNTLLQFSSFQTVVHAYPDRITGRELDGRFGITLIQKAALEKYPFDFGDTDPQNPHTWWGSEPWFLQRIVRDGGSYIELHGLIKPIYHLNE